MKNSSVSIVIPVYNVQDYIVKCLDSVAAQTYTGSMECLIIDDCGTDDSIRLAEQYVKQYNGHIVFRIIHHEHNKGLSAARNTGIKEAQGDWLYFLDSDDWIIPECIEWMVNVQKTHPQSEIVQGGATATGNNQCFQWLNIANKSLPPYSDDKKWIKQAFLTDLTIPVTAWNKLVRRDFIISNDLFFTEKVIHEDVIWTFFLAKRVSHIAFCMSNTYMYRLREGSIMQTEKGIHPDVFFIIDILTTHIDDFCRDVQIAFIYNQIKERIYKISQREESRKISHRLMALSAKANGLMSMGLYLYAISPLWVKRRRHVIRSMDKIIKHC